MKEKYGNLMRIDSIINRLEFYLRGKYRAKFGFCNVKKCFNSKSHFSVEYEGLITNYKFTTSCYEPKATIENPAVVVNVLEDGLPDEGIFLKIPRGDQRLKNWGETDIVVCEYSSKKQIDVSWVYYISREALFNYIDKGKNIFEDFISWDIGVPLRSLMNKGIVIEVDKLYWKENRYETLFSKDEEKSWSYFINFWKGTNEDMAINNRTAFFPGYKPLPYADRRKKIILTAENGNTVEFDSITSAANKLNITEVSISRLLNKRQKKLFVSMDGKKVRITKAVVKA
jgi:hypothetical protein